LPVGSARYDENFGKQASRRMCHVDVDDLVEEPDDENWEIERQFYPNRFTRCRATTQMRPPKLSSLVDQH
jgi:hypothetical protein